MMTRRVSPVRLAAGAVLAAWGAMFWWLVLSGRTGLYLSSRTAWVAPLGALLLSAAALGRLASARTESAEPLTTRRAWWLGFLAIPVIAVVALPPATLGSYAAARRSAVGAGLVGADADLSSGPVTLDDVAGALWSTSGMQALVDRAGTRVSFVGFVDRRDGMAADEFLLTRFVVSCCVADALSVQVRVVGTPSGRFARDQWVQVTGTLYPLPDEVVLLASTIEPVARPARPYLDA